MVPISARLMQHTHTYAHTAGDMKINVCKTKALTNMRAAGSDKKVRKAACQRETNLKTCLPVWGEDR
eukprot:1137345-Pelagomonas_calceolata.AAC.14